MSKRNGTGRIKVAFDLDGCLVDFNMVLMRHLSDLVGRPLNDPQVFSLEEAFGIGELVVNRALHLTYMDWKSVKEMEGANELVTTLYKKTGNPILVITARPHFVATETHLLVQNAVMKGKVPYILIFAYGRDKGEYIRDYPFMVEDRLSTARQLAKEGKTVFLMDAPYNREGTLSKGIIRMSGIRDLIPLIPILTEE